MDAIIFSTEEIVTIHDYLHRGIVFRAGRIGADWSPSPMGIGFHRGNRYMVRTGTLRIALFRYAVGL
jgi:hypothetical protein